MFRTKATAYAIIGAVEVARQYGEGSSPVLVAEIASTYDLPTAYFSKVMSLLAKARILQSDRGPKGGFRLSRPPNKITLFEIYEAVEGPLQAGEAYEMPASMREGINDAIARTTSAIAKRLSMTTLADLMSK